MASLFGHVWLPAMLVVAAAILILTGLGNDHLWEDEADTAVLARTILTRGVPVAWDGAMLAVPDHGERLDGDLVMVSHPWLQYYLAAGSFALLGETPFAARLPFALAAILMVVVVYLMVVRLLSDRRAAFTAAALLLLNVQFLLYARQARNYSVNALLTCLVVWLFLRLDSWRQAIVLTLVGLLLFHAHPIGLVTIAVLGLLTVACRSFHPQRRFFWPAALTIAVYAVPWLGASRAGFAENADFSLPGARFFPRILQFLIEIASVTPLLAVVVLLGVAIVRWRAVRPTADRAPRGRLSAALRRARDSFEAVFSPGERAFLILWATLILAYTGTMALTQTRDVIWIVGVRYASAVLPLTAMAAGLLVTRTAGDRRLTWAALTLALGFTNLGRLTPWVLWADSLPLRPPDAVVAFHVPTRALDGLVRTTQFRYIESLAASNPGTIAAVSDYLSAHASPGDIVITNYAWEALYFDTRLPQGLKVRESYPIYRVVAGRLPSYVYSAQGVRWIVWRRAWAPYWGQDCEQLVRQLTDAGVRVDLVAQVPETLYENRENVHFRRFARDAYVFSWFDELPSALIFRVEWPAGERRGGGS